VGAEVDRCARTDEGVPADRRTDREGRELAARLWDRMGDPEAGAQIASRRFAWCEHVVQARKKLQLRGRHVGCYRRVLEIRERIGLDFDLERAVRDHQRHVEVHLLARRPAEREAQTGSPEPRAQIGDLGIARRTRLVAERDRRQTEVAGALDELSRHG
jgi:hypothetical protein